jgi:hypothetical protein
MYDLFYPTCYTDELQTAYPPIIKNASGQFYDLKDPAVRVDMSARMYMCLPLVPSRDFRHVQLQLHLWCASMYAHIYASPKFRPWRVCDC